mmetsp:Transcript_27187/g.27064  ORF Transcript_27187/g.27064 Transcript_27187/m.27064 type:complete len:88 (+) Transcript_27187:1-264(+)
MESLSETPPAIPEDSEVNSKSVLNIKWNRLSNDPVSCPYCKNIGENKLHITVLTTTKLRTDDYEKLLDLGWIKDCARHLFKPDTINS